ncbi:unnamed protein product, partial [Symbiodinium pilosum]
DSWWPSRPCPSRRAGAGSPLPSRGTRSRQASSRRRYSLDWLRRRTRILGPCRRGVHGQHA